LGRSDALCTRREEAGRGGILCLTLPAAADLDSADALLDLGDAIAAQF
jgi:hypothetical protein